MIAVRSLDRVVSASRGMRGLSVYIAGQGRVPVTRKTDTGLASMGGEAINSALDDAGLDGTAPQVRVDTEPLTSDFCRRCMLAI